MDFQTTWLPFFQRRWCIHVQSTRYLSPVLEAYGKGVAPFRAKFRKYMGHLPWYDEDTVRSVTGYLQDGGQATINDWPVLLQQQQQQLSCAVPAARGGLTAGGH